MTEKTPAEMDYLEWVQWLRDTKAQRRPLPREEAMTWQAARARLTAPTEKERAVNQALLALHIDEDET